MNSAPRSTRIEWPVIRRASEYGRGECLAGKPASPPRMPHLSLRFIASRKNDIHQRRGFPIWFSPLCFSPLRPSQRVHFSRLRSPGWSLFRPEYFLGKPECGRMKLPLGLSLLRWSGQPLQGANNKNPVQAPSLELGIQTRQALTQRSNTLQSSATCSSSSPVDVPSRNWPMGSQCKWTPSMAGAARPRFLWPAAACGLSTAKLDVGRLL
jgi:hypothetical protein